MVLVSHEYDRFTADAGLLFRLSKRRLKKTAAASQQHNAMSKEHMQHARAARTSIKGQHLPRNIRVLAWTPTGTRSLLLYQKQDGETASSIVALYRTSAHASIVNTHSKGWTLQTVSNSKTLFQPPICGGQALAYADAGMCFKFER
jgi:hypothetical protein